VQNPCCCDTPAPHLRCRAYDATTVGVTNPTYNCTKAWGSRSYNLYTGNSSYLARKDSAFYNSTPANETKFGWYPEPCTTSLKYICEIPETMYTCPPTPPAPPAKPPGSCKT
jgi:hypothetical protein